MKDILMRVGMILVALMLAYKVGVWDERESTTKRLYEAQSVHTKELQEVRDETQRKLSAVASDYAVAQKESEEHAAGTVAALRRDGVRLSVQLADRTIESVQGYNRGLADGRAELHPATAEALVRITEDADRQVKGLQDSLKAVTQ